MSIFDQQMRSLTVAPVMLDAPRKIVPEIFPQASSKLKGLFAPKKPVSSFSQPKDEYLLILTCDRLAILKGDPANEGSVHGATASGSITPPPPQQQEQPNPPFVSIPLSLLKDAHSEGSTLVIEHYLPHIGHKSKQPSSPTGTTTSTTPLSPAISSTSSSATNGSSSLLFNDDGGFSFPLISASVAAISRLRRGDAPDTGRAILRLHTESEETAKELAKAVHTALQRLLNALLWLDRGLPLEVETSLAISTVSFTTKEKEEIILTRAPAWGSTVKLPLAFTKQATSAESSSINIDICTPLGPCHAIIAMQTLFSLPSGEDLTVSVCGVEARGAAGSLNLSASVTIGNVVIGTTTAPTATEEASSAGTLVNRHVDTSATTEEASPAFRQTQLIAGCSTLVLCVSTLYYRLPTIVLMVLFGLIFRSLRIMLQQVENGSSQSGRIKSASRTTAATTGVHQGSKEIKVIDSFTLLHAEIVEGPGDDIELAPLPSSKESQKPLARQITASLARRDSYMQRSGSITTSPSFTRMKSVKAQQQQHQQQPGGALIDIGAVSLRRVVSRSIAGPSTTVLSVEEKVAISKLQVQRRVTGISETKSEAQHEAEVLAKLHALSSAITPALFERYITACGGDRKKALTRLKATAEWRAENGIDDILTSPVPRFKAIKAAYLHSVIGWTRDQTMPVVVEGMGGFKKALLQLHSDNITPAEMIQQFVFVLEWVLNDLTQGKSGSFVRIYDLKGIRLFDLADKEAIALGQQMMDLLEKYYPERMAQAFVVNTPSFFATAWKMVKPMLDPRTAKKIQVLAGTQQTLAALQELMDDDVIPVAYGGKNPIEGYDLGFTGGWYKGEIEKQIATLAEDLTSRG